MASASRNAARSGRRGKERRPWLAALQASRARDRARGRKARGGKRGGTPRRDEPRDAPWWPSSGARGLSTDGGACGCGCARRSAANAANRTSEIKPGEPQLWQIAPNPQNAPLSGISCVQNGARAITTFEVLFGLRRSGEKNVALSSGREKAPARHSAPRAPPASPLAARRRAGPRRACRRWTAPSAPSSAATATSSGGPFLGNLPPEILDAVVRTPG